MNTQRHKTGSSRVPKIRNGKATQDLYNAALGFWLPPDTPYGNLQLKNMKIVLRLDEANRRIASAYRHWAKLQSTLSSGAFWQQGHALSRHHFELESAVFQMQRVADELIGLERVLTHFEQGGKCPERLTVDCIGRLLRDEQLCRSSPYAIHLDCLRILNDIHTAHKHSFANSDLNLMGACEPVIYALGLSQNRLSAGPKFYSVAAGDLVNQFSDFYDDLSNWLRNWSQANLNKTAA